MSTIHGGHTTSRTSRKETSTTEKWLSRDLLSDVKKLEKLELQCRVKEGVSYKTITFSSLLQDIEKNGVNTQNREHFIALYKESVQTLLSKEKNINDGKTYPNVDPNIAKAAILALSNVLIFYCGMSKSDLKKILKDIDKSSKTAITDIFREIPKTRTDRINKKASENALSRSSSPVRSKTVSTPLTSSLETKKAKIEDKSAATKSQSATAIKTLLDDKMKDLKQLGNLTSFDARTYAQEGSEGIKRLTRWEGTHDLNSEENRAATLASAGSIGKNLSQKNIESTYQQVRKAQGGVCTSLGAAAVHVLTGGKRQSGDVHIELMGCTLESGRGHVYAVVGREPKSNPKDPSAWGPNACIVDPWLWATYPETVKNGQLLTVAEILKDKASQALYFGNKSKQGYEKLEHVYDNFAPDPKETPVKATDRTALAGKVERATTDKKEARKALDSSANAVVAMLIPKKSDEPEKWAAISSLKKYLESSTTNQDRYVNSKFSKIVEKVLEFEPLPKAVDTFMQNLENYA